MTKKTSPPNASVESAGMAFSARRRFSIAMREPLRLPEVKVVLPAPLPAPNEPAPVNVLTNLLVPIVMLVASVAAFLIGEATDSKAALWVSLLMLLPTMAFPLVNILNAAADKKAYNKALEKRTWEYVDRLKREEAGLDQMVGAQREALQVEYPPVSQLAEIALRTDRRLWWRRPADPDFLSLRLGSGSLPASFKVELPQIDSRDPLAALPTRLTNLFGMVSDLPVLLPLGQIGSAVIAGNSTRRSAALAQGLVLDALVHHSPQDVRLVVLADSRDAAARWEWLKWAPHTSALDPDEDDVHLLAFTTRQVDRCREWLADEYNHRKEQSRSLQSGPQDHQNAILVVLDDERARRQHDIAVLAGQGGQVGIHLLFVGGQDCPRECRSRVELDGEGNLRYFETLPGEPPSVEMTGKVDPFEPADCERVSRALAGLEAPGERASVRLPDTVRLSQVVGGGVLEPQDVISAWEENAPPERLLRFPIGLQAGPDGLEPAVVDFLPEELRGGGNYHMILIGTTGSGKSEFMKSVVLASALKYSPRDLALFFMDFKGGATFDALAKLPHSTGYVTNLDRPDLVDRGLAAIASEIDRRQAQLKSRGAKNIWEYNQEREVPQPLPHLVIMLDEFTRGLAEFPQLRPILDTLVRQGRSLGMYLILANQDPNSEVNNLTTNVGWLAALKVAKREDMALIDPNLKPTTRRGHGHVRSQKGDIVAFQGAYAGFPLLGESAAATEEFSIQAVLPDGRLGEALYTQKARAAEDGPGRPSAIEEGVYLQLIRQAASTLGLQAAPIYLEPMPVDIPLSTVFTDPGLPLPPKFYDGSWDAEQTTARSLLAPIGFLDVPQERRRELLAVDFLARDGHLWIVGGAGAGKGMVLTTLLLSLALMYTPQEAQFYVLGYSSEPLFHLEGLPHLGAIIRLQERERLQRLLNFMDAELERRAQLTSRSADGLGGLPELFLVIDNYAELFTNFPDENDRMARYARNGKAAGLHLIVTTNRGSELMRNVPITRKIVLELNDRDEYFDLVGRQVAPPGTRTPGRGVWVDEQANECQIAQVSSEEAKELVQTMRAEWKQGLPPPIEVLPACVPLESLLARIAAPAQGAAPFPVGLAHTDLGLVAPDLFKELPHWLILGPRESGKSNFLVCAARSRLHLDSERWEIRLFGLRPTSPLLRFGRQEKRLLVFTGADEIGAEFLRLGEALAQPEVEGGPHLLLLIDDLGPLLEDMQVQASLDALAVRLAVRQDVVLMAAGLFEEVRMQMGSQLLNLLRQSRTGLLFTNDISDLDWLGASVSLEQRRVEMVPGRGYFISHAKAQLVQTPFDGKC